MNRSSRVLLLAVLLAVYPAQSAYSDSLQSFLPDSDTAPGGDRSLLTPPAPLPAPQPRELTPPLSEGSFSAAPGELSPPSPAGPLAPEFSMPPLLGVGGPGWTYATGEVPVLLPDSGLENFGRCYEDWKLARQIPITLTRGTGGT